jgi:hypothetical protein
MSGGKPVNIRIWDTANKAWEKWDGVLSTGDLAIGAVEIKDHDGTDRMAVDSSNSGAVAIKNKLVPEYYDYIELTYTGSNLTTVDYKTGGSGGTTVASLALAYTGSQLDSITKT